jgi:predicted anti-sigma-YlaC factor YlaD
MPVLNLTCRDLIEHAGSYRDGELTPAQVKIVEAHLAGCAKCRDYLGRIALQSSWRKARCAKRMTIRI